MLEPLTRNWPLKMLAVSLAFGIWVSVTGESEIVRDFHPPLDIRLPEDRILTVNPPTTVTVRLRGTDTSLRKFDALLLAVGVDLSDGLVGERDIALDEAHLTGVPSGIEFEFISPDRLTLTVDQRIQTSLPVEATFLGKLPDGYTMYAYEVQPTHLDVEGPEAEVEVLERLNTSSIRLDELTQPGSLRVSSVPDSRHVRIVGSERLLFVYTVDTSPVEKSFEAVPVVLTGQLWEAESSISEVKITMTGPVDLLDKIQPELLEVRADLAGLEPQSDSYDVDLVVSYDGGDFDLQDRIKIKSLRPRKIRVRVQDRSFSL